MNTRAITQNKKVVTFGEVMLRLTAPNFQRFSQTNEFIATYGGSEANVAISLVNFGIPTEFVTRLPENAMAQACVNSLQAYGLGTDGIIYGGKRMGLYFLESGAAFRNSNVVYDREGSSFATLRPGMIDWEKILSDAGWFHWSGITPAISDKAAELTKLACEAAKRHGVTVSVDLNFRKKLWTKEKAQSIMKPLMQYVDVCIGNEEDAEKTLGVKNTADVNNGKTDAECYMDTCRTLQSRFGFSIVASTLRESLSASHNGWKAMLYDGKEFYQSKRYDILPIVDRVGAGDSFSAGLIHGLTSGMQPAQALEFAVAASALKHTIPGDVNMVSEAEVLALANGNGNGRVQR